MNHIKKFTIFGERNSGTNYLLKTLNEILYLDFTSDFGFKHWYIKNLEPRGIQNTTTDNECIKSLKYNDDTLFIVTVRNINDWVCSMFNKPYHIQQMNKNSLYNFVSNKYLCYLDNCPINHGPRTKTPYTINKNNKYPFFIEEANNLIQLRNMKNEHFYKLKDNVRYYYIIRQEYILQDIKDMIIKFKLNHKPIVLKNYISPKKYNIDSKTKEFIDKELNNYIDNNYEILNLKK